MTASIRLPDSRGRPGNCGRVQSARLQKLALQKSIAARGGAPLSSGSRRLLGKRTAAAAGLSAQPQKCTGCAAARRQLPRAAGVMSSRAGGWLADFCFATFTSRTFRRISREVLPQMQPQIRQQPLVADPAAASGWASRHLHTKEYHVRAMRRAQRKDVRRNKSPVL